MILTISIQRYHHRPLVVGAIDAQSWAGIASGVGWIQREGDRGARYTRCLVKGGHLNNQLQ